MKREWLTKTRKTRNLSQIDVIKLANSILIEGKKITQQYYSSIENGKRRPSVEVAKALGKVLKFKWGKFYE